MPLWDVGCKQCNHEFEVLHKNSERGEVVCPKCGGELEYFITKVNKDWFRPHYNEGLDTYVESKRHLKSLCLEQNVTSRALGDVRNITEI